MPPREETPGGSDELGRFLLGEEGRNNAQEISDNTGLKKLGTHGIPPLVGRAVTVNMAKHRGVTAMAAGDTISAADIQAAARAQGVTFKAGDIILVPHRMDGRQAGLGSKGLDNAAAVYLAGLNPIAVGADTCGVEVVPPKQGDKIFYGHVTFLKENGIYIRA